jgi:hypothetical protein
VDRGIKGCHVQRSHRRVKGAQRALDLHADRPPSGAANQRPRTHNARSACLPRQRLAFQPSRQIDGSALATPGDLEPRCAPSCDHNVPPPQREGALERRLRGAALGVRGDWTYARLYMKSV